MDGHLCVVEWRPVLAGSIHHQNQIHLLLHNGLYTPSVLFMCSLTHRSHNHLPRWSSGIQFYENEENAAKVGRNYRMQYQGFFRDRVIAGARSYVSYAFDMLIVFKSEGGMNYLMCKMRAHLLL